MPNSSPPSSAAAPDAAAFDAAYFARSYRHYAAQNPARKLGFYRRVLRRHLASERPADLLDVGCGLGAWLAHLEAETNWRLHGTDLSEWAIDQSRRRLPNVELRVAGATDMPYPNAHFDAITACDVIEHVPDRDRAASAIRAMLRPGGLFLLVVPVYDGLSGPLIRRLDKDPTHVHKLARGNWIDWMRGRFTLLESWGVLRYLLPGGFYLHLPTRLLRRHTPAILLLGRKPVAP